MRGAHGSSVFEWQCCVCSQTRLGHGPRHRGRQVQGVGKVAFRPAAGRRKRIPGAARSFFHRLARARSGAPQQAWFPCWARNAGIALAFVLVGGVAGRPDRPAEVGAEDAKQPQTGGDLLPISSLYIEPERHRNASPSRLQAGTSHRAPLVSLPTFVSYPKSVPH